MEAHPSFDAKSLYETQYEHSRGLWSAPTEAHKIRYNFSERQKFSNRSFFLARYVPGLSKKPKTKAVSLYSSKPPTIRLISVKLVETI